jgi:hypothetical protein
MKFDKLRYVATNGKEYIFDFAERCTKEIKKITDVFDLVMWDNLQKAQEDLEWFKGKSYDNEELEYFKKFHIEAIKVHIEL